jgi:hypothetical protein
MIKSSYIKILTYDMDRSVKWYQENFDFKLLIKMMKMLEIAPGVPFFIDSTSGEIARNRIYHGGTMEEIGFIADDMENLHQRLKDNGNLQ